MSETIFNIPIAVNLSMSASVNSDATDLSKADGYSITAVWTGSPVGLIQLEVSSDDVNFFVDPDSITEVNGVGQAFWEIDTARYDKVRLSYVRTSGSGTLNASIYGKGDFR